MSLDISIPIVLRIGTTDCQIKHHEMHAYIVELLAINITDLDRKYGALSRILPHLSMICFALYYNDVTWALISPIQMAT